jgi:uncharacterized RDD family membrane protein YckC
VDNKIDGVPGDPDEATRAEWPTTSNETSPIPDAPPAPGPPPQASGPMLPPAIGVGASIPPPPGAPVPWGPPGGVGGAALAPPPVGGGQYVVPGAPGLEFAGALPRFVAYVIDLLILAVVNLVAGIVVATVLAAALVGGGTTIVGLGVGLVTNAAYFIGFWTTAGQATLGMRILHLQVGNAYDGHKLDMGQAFRRWVALGAWLSAIGLTATLSGIAALAAAVWALLLLITTVTSPTKQGLHDRFANTAVVRPAGSSNGVILGCFLIIAIVVCLFMVSIVALIFLGGPIADILPKVGTSA